jgi:hypothetical protein
MSAKMALEFTIVETVLMQALAEKRNVKSIVFTEQRVPIELSLFFGEIIRVWNLRLFE